MSCDGDLEMNWELLDPEITTCHRYSRYYSGDKERDRRNERDSDQDP
jgi:hypothetical protein